MNCYKRYRMRNTTQGNYEYVWVLETDPVPTVLPDNPADGVGDVSIIEKKLYPFNPDSVVDLPKAKILKCIEIDLKTGALIEQGFMYDGKLLSASSHAQRNAEAALIKKDVLIYPFAWSTIDNLDSVLIDSAATIAALESAMFTAVKGKWDSGNALKDQVRSAIDIAAVAAIVDTRA